MLVCHKFCQNVVFGYFYQKKSSATHTVKRLTPKKRRLGRKSLETSIILSISINLISLHLNEGWQSPFLLHKILQGLLLLLLLLLLFLWSYCVIYTNRVSWSYHANAFYLSLSLSLSLPVFSLLFFFFLFYSLTFDVKI